MSNLIYPEDVTETKSWGIDPSSIIDLLKGLDCGFYSRPSKESITNWILTIYTYDFIAVDIIITLLRDNMSIGEGFSVNKTKTGYYEISVPCVIPFGIKKETNSIPIIRCPELRSYTVN